ncbi:MAG: zincin-like metallopeptidase domain-containing protein [Nitrososphaeraceae archaeon]|nr:zincin-like metallopeptidase domain-containing protein [Nitrososphaeraceae archaeon]
MNQNICESIVNGYPKKPKIFQGIENIPCYFVDVDIIHLPDYTDLEDYYRDLFHELIHSTGHPSRLNRETILTTNYFNSTKDHGTVEELTATFGEMVLCHFAEIHTGKLKKTITECFQYYDIKQNSVNSAQKYMSEAVLYILKN